MKLSINWLLNTLSRWPNFDVMSYDRAYIFWLFSEFVYNLKKAASSPNVHTPCEALVTCQILKTEKTKVNKKCRSKSTCPLKQSNFHWYLHRIFSLPHPPIPTTSSEITVTISPLDDHWLSLFAGLLYPLQSPSHDNDGRLHSMMTLDVVSSTAGHCCPAPASPRVVTLKMMPRTSPRQTVVIFFSTAWLHFRTHNALQDGCSAVDDLVVQYKHLKGKVRRFVRMMRFHLNVIDFVP